MNDDFKTIELINNTDSPHDTELEKVRTNVCSKIIQILDDKKLSTRDAEKLTGISHTEFSRIRNAKLQRFTLDRLIIILGKLDPQIEINIGFENRAIINHEPKAIEGIYKPANERTYIKNLAGNDVSIFLYRFELLPYGIDFVVNEVIAADMYPDIAVQLTPLAHKCCEILTRYRDLSISDTIMDGSILTTNEFEVMLSKGLGIHLFHDEKMRLFKYAEDLADLLIKVISRRAKEANATC
jgi:predicted XRE-type DNA-binding protein